MQRMGGGALKGGGNDPSCGCDMQAGWPSAADLPRGGLQGGGNWNFNEFNLALSKNGKTKHLRGKWNKNNGNNSRKNNKGNNNKGNNNKGNNNKGNNNKGNNNKGNNNKGNNNKKNTNKKYKMVTSAPPKLENLMYEGKLYKTDPASGNTYENNEYVGKYVRPNNGTPYLDRSGPQTPNYPPPNTPKTPNYPPRSPNYAPPNTPKTPNYPPPDDEDKNSSVEYDTEETNNKKTPKTLSMNGGGRTRKQKHGKGCPCWTCMLKRLKFAGGGMPACGSCPFPGTGYCDFYARGGGQKGGGCGCSAGLFKGGYRPTKKNLKYLKKWKRGESIGFTMTSSLKAKGLIPRTSRKMKGKKVVSRKYR